MDTAQTIRRRNFQRLVADVWGGHRALVADALGFKEPNLVTRYMSDGRSAKNIGHELARKIETAARTFGAEWVSPGWMDMPQDAHSTPPPKHAKSQTLDQRIAALPPALRQYILMELDLCERAQALAPGDLLRPPTTRTRRSFQDYLALLVGQAGGRKRHAA